MRNFSRVLFVLVVGLTTVLPAQADGPSLPYRVEFAPDGGIFVIYSTDTLGLAVQHYSAERHLLHSWYHQAEGFDVMPDGNLVLTQGRLIPGGNYLERVIEVHIVQPDKTPISSWILPNYTARGALVRSGNLPNGTVGLYLLGIAYPDGISFGRTATLFGTSLDGEVYFAQPVPGEAVALEVVGEEVLISTQVDLEWLLQRYDKQGRLIGTWRAPQRIVGITGDSQELFLVGDAGGSSLGGVRGVSYRMEQGQLVAAWGLKGDPKSVTLGPDGSLYVPEVLLGSSDNPWDFWRRHVISRYSTTGELLETWFGGRPPPKESVYLPLGFK